MKAVRLALFSFALSLTLGACAGQTRHIAVQVDASVYTAVTAVDDAELALCNAKTLTVAQCDSLNPKIKAALLDVRAVTAALQAIPKSGTVPKTLPDLILTLRAVQDIALALPSSPATSGLVSKINGALDAALGLLSKIAGV